MPEFEHPFEIHSKSSDAVFRIGRMAERYTEKICDLARDKLSTFCQDVPKKKENFPSFKIYRRRWLNHGDKKKLPLFISTYYDLPSYEGELPQEIKETIKATITDLKKKKTKIQQLLDKTEADKSGLQRVYKNWLDRIAEMGNLNAKQEFEAWYYLLKIFSFFPQIGGIPYHVAEHITENSTDPGRAYLVETIEGPNEGGLPNLNIWEVKVPQTEGKSVLTSEFANVTQQEFLGPESGKPLPGDCMKIYNSLVSIFQEHGWRKTEQDWVGYVWLCIPVYDISHLGNAAGSLQGILFQILKYPDTIRDNSNNENFKITINLDMLKVSDKEACEAFNKYVKACIILSDNVSNELVAASIDEILKQELEKDAVTHLRKKICHLGDYHINLLNPGSGIEVDLSEWPFDPIHTSTHSGGINEIYVTLGEDVCNPENQKLKATIGRRVRGLYSRINERLWKLKKVEEEKEKKRIADLIQTTYSLGHNLKNRLLDSDRLMRGLSEDIERASLNESEKLKLSKWTTGVSVKLKSLSNTGNLLDLIGGSMNINVPENIFKKKREWHSMEELNICSFLKEFYSNSFFAVSTSGNYAKIDLPNLSKDLKIEPWFRTKNNKIRPSDFIYEEIFFELFINALSYGKSYYQNKYNLIDIEVNQNSDTIIISNTPGISINLNSKFEKIDKNKEIDVKQVGHGGLLYIGNFLSQTKIGDIKVILDGTNNLFKVILNLKGLKTG